MFSSSMCCRGSYLAEHHIANRLAADLKSDIPETETSRLVSLRSHFADNCPIREDRERAPFVIRIISANYRNQANLA